MDYPHWENRRKMLRLLSDATDERRKVHGDDQLMLFFKRGSRLTGEAQLLVRRTGQDVAEDLNLSGAEAMGLLNELGGDECLHLDSGRLGPHASTRFVNVRFRNKGRVALEQLPDPNQELIIRLDRIAAVIEALQDIDPEEKTRAQQAVGELKTFGRKFRQRPLWRLVGRCLGVTFP